MAKVHITIKKDLRNLDSLVRDADSGKIGARANDYLYDALVEAIESLWSGNYPPASKPFEPPAVRSGTLRESARKTETRALVHRTVLTFGAKYAGYLEYGTSLMAPRPFLRPAIAKTSELLAEAVQLAVFYRFEGA